MIYNVLFLSLIHISACQLLNIHRGDRMKTLVAMDTKAVTGPELVKQYQKEEAPDLSLIHI